MAIVGFTQLLSFMLFASVVWAQDRPANRQFMWKWKNPGIAFQIAPCIPLELEVMSWNVSTNDTFGVPPYYMQAFPLGGTPTTTLLGTSNSSLSWTNTYAPGTKLLLTVVDSTGSYGGVPGSLVEVINGVSNGCVVPEPSAPEFTVTPNITRGERLRTCEPWSVEIKGGVPPYNLSIAVINSPVITNVTIPSGFDAFTYINRAETGRTMIIGISDLTGRWATGTPYVETYGSEDYECVGLVSSSSTAARLKEETDARKRAANKRRTGIIVGVTVPLVIILLALIGGGVWWYRRRQERQAREPAPDSVEPYSYHEEPLTLPAGLYGSSSGYSPVSKSALETSQMVNVGESGVLSYATAPSGAGSPSIHGSFSHSSAFTSSDTAHTGGVRTRPSFNTFPVRPSTSKSAEAAQAPVILSPDSEYASGSSARPVSGGGEEIIIQHRDGGGVVRELPPPYADRSRLEE
ncbi:hypothetical protein EST38_g3548 [Candolleomyces aberdarensis]|uniref:Mid2 domain-containing protein n=1 Tax=Candolleomyces aberdarensis TaxID=2316362 RepID=A0A4Q2DRZ7_9AGAR|nr:hypothetical protein EST38_g3548 [Candolleomyces aberdarensis]